MPVQHSDEESSDGTAPQGALNRGPAQQVVITGANVQQQSSSESFENGVVLANPGSSMMQVSEVKMQPFYENDPELWFMIVEQQFATKRITSERSKYAHVVSNLNCNTAIQVKGIIKASYVDGHYDRLKQALIAIYAETATEKVRKLISNADIGDRKPSQFLHYMQSLTDESVNDDFIKKLWIQRLPPTLRAILSTSRDNLETLAKMADSMWEVTDRFTISSVKREEDTLEKISKKLDDLSERLSLIENGNRKSRRDATPHRRASTSKSQARDNDDNKHDKCWYHYKYGEKATKCRSPCKFKSKN